MKVLILAAGKGERLYPLTKDRPKCLVPVFGRPMLDWQLGTFKKLNIQDISVVTGYRHELFKPYGLKTFHNAEYETTNMVYSLLKARDLFDGSSDILISYSDIIFNTKTIAPLASYQGSFGVAVNSKWRELWSARMENPLDDAETLKINAQNKIFEIGKKPKSYADIEGQFMGLIKIGAAFAREFIARYETLPNDMLYDGKKKPSMFMTSYLQSFFDQHIFADPIFIEGQWLEIDSLADIKKYEELKNMAQLNSYLELQANI